MEVWIFRFIGMVIDNVYNYLDIFLVKCLNSLFEFINFNIIIKWIGRVRFF